MTVGAEPMLGETASPWFEGGMIRRPGSATALRPNFCSRASSCRHLVRLGEGPLAQLATDGAGEIGAGEVVGE